MNATVCSTEVAAALADGRPVVALESTIFSHLGLPSPANAEALDRSCEAVRAHGAVPAITAVLDGVPRVGLEVEEHHRILGPAVKCAERDLGWAIATGVEVGATTVSASLALAASAGIQVFATGGIGGVHRDVNESGDISADLGAIARHPVVTVSAGAKVFLDLARTLEYLEAASVNVLGWQTDEFPAFTARTSGLPVPHRVEGPQEVAGQYLAARSIGLSGGTLVVVPVPAADAVPNEIINAAVAKALGAAADEGLSGPGVTPAILQSIAEATDGLSVPANLSLAEQNAGVAAQIAGALAQ